MKRIISNLIWRFLERCGAQGVTLIVSLILARLLNPEIYGTIALIMVIIAIFEVFVDSGFGTALIQKKDADELDFSSVFYFNVFICFILYFIIFLISPLIAAFYNNNDLVPIIRVLGLIVVFSGIKNIQQAYVSRNMLFKKFFFSTMIGTIISALIGIGLAYNGYGVWAIVVQMILNTAIDTVVLWITVDWRPKWQFSFERLRVLFLFGWKILASSLIYTVYKKTCQLIIGKVYSEADLGFYNQGEQIPYTLTTNINASIDSVLLPVMSSAQDNLSILKSMTRKSIQLGTFVIFPCMAGMIACADPLVRVILTDKWLPCVPYLRIFCLSYAFWPIHTANLNAIKALGRSDIFLKVEIIKLIISIVIILFTVNISPFALACGSLLSNFICIFINAFPNIKLLKYSFYEQIKDLFPNFIFSVLMGAIVFLVSRFNASVLVVLLIQIPLGIILYVLFAIIIRNESFIYLLNSIKEFRSKSREL